MLSTARNTDILAYLIRLPKSRIYLGLHKFKTNNALQKIIQGALTMWTDYRQEEIESSVCSYLCHWNMAHGHCCRGQTHFGGVAGSRFLKTKPDSHGVRALLPQGRRRCSSWAECRPLWAPGRGKGWARAAPPPCSWRWEGCRCNSGDCTYLERMESGGREKPFFLPT